jgi:hypothetical protein
LVERWLRGDEEEMMSAWVEEWMKHERQGDECMSCHWQMIVQ